MDDITLFIHRPGIEAPIELQVGGSLTPHELIARPEIGSLVIEIGIAADEILIFVEENASPLPKHIPITHGGAKHGSRLHMSRGHEVEVDIHFVGRTAKHNFPPGTRLRRIKDWAVQHFGLAANDAIEHVLKVEGSSEIPSPGWPLSALVRGHHCKVSLDLVPAKRVEG